MGKEVRYPNDPVGVIDHPLVFVGRHASLAFLQLFRKIVSKCIGVSEFSHNADRDVMLEAELVSSGQFDVQDFLSRHQNLEETWIDSFLTAVSEPDRISACC
jgi:hypothetical protein